MPREKIEFANADGEKLAGLLELPDAQPLAFALFAHCFTCGKDVAAASRVSRALAARGIAVLRFDFTGLGNSDGDFANTNFSSNVDDLLAAADWLRSEHEAPTLLIGHSLGGAAVLRAAHEISEVQAVCTIGAPATASHVQHLFAASLDQIREAGEATVKIGLREFSVKQQLLDDLDEYGSTDHIGNLKKPLLIFHSPVDNIVSVDEAAAIYRAAKHPKSFVSLDQADHLLSKPEDAEYVATTLTVWAGRYLQLRVVTDLPDVPEGEVLITEENLKFLRGLHTADHHLLADEPASYGGGNAGPTPYDLLLMGLGACTSMTLRMYAKHKKIPLQDLDVWLKHERIHADDCEECDQGVEGKIERIARRISLKGDLTEEQRQGLLKIADRCPVHRTLEAEPVITTVLIDE